MGEEIEFKCNRRAKITFGVAVAITLIGVILYVVGVILASQAIDQALIVDGQTDFTLWVPATYPYDTRETRHERRSYTFYTENSNVEGYGNELGVKCYGI
eukprot:Skav216011  [mRNA]  locus=scaffold833:281186:281485:+ [translate_table: standard]